MTTQNLTVKYYVCFRESSRSQFSEYMLFSFRTNARVLVLFSDWTIKIGIVVSILLF